MKNKILILLLILLCEMISYGQTADTLIFTTKKFSYKYVSYQNFIYLRPSIDSILIQNLTQGGEIMLYKPDTILVLSQYTGISKNDGHSEDHFFMIQNNPNPFNEKTSVSVYLPVNELVKISVYNVLGRILTTYEGYMQSGNHEFSFFPGNEKLYFFSVEISHHREIVKMVHIGNTINDQCRIEYNGFDQIKPLDKQLKKVKSSFLWAPGNNLRFYGYANIGTNINVSDMILDNPTQSELYIFDMKRGILCADFPFATDADGNTYRSVQIGKQCWLNENLKTTKYNDGTNIPLETNNTAWINMATPGYCWYGNDMAQYKTRLGALYNWYAVSTGKLCPLGWRTATDDEWKTLENYQIDNAYNYDGTNIGNKIAKSMADGDSIGSPWYTSTDIGTPGYEQFCNNNSGFRARPGGNRCSNTGVFYLGGGGYYGGWWTSTPSSSTYAWMRYMQYNVESEDRMTGSKKIGLSVRCIRN